MSRCDCKASGRLDSRPGRYRIAAIRCAGPPVPGSSVRRSGARHSHWTDTQSTIRRVRSRRCLHSPRREEARPPPRNRRTVRASAVADRDSFCLGGDLRRGVVLVEPRRYFGPTMLGFVSERNPCSGALGLGLMGSVGMTVVGLFTPHSVRPATHSPITWPMGFYRQSLPPKRCGPSPPPKATSRPSRKQAPYSARPKTTGAAFRSDTSSR